MAYVTAEARQDLLDTIADAAEQIGAALAYLGAAYETLDERNGDALEEQLFRPVQGAYGRVKRTHAEFAARHALPEGSFPAATPPAGAASTKELLERAVQAAGDADDELSTLQDSMLPVEVGDPELRAGLAEVRSLLGVVPGHARGFLRLLGR